MQHRAVGPRSVFLGLVIVALAGCANTDPVDSGWNVADTGRSDATSMMDTSTGSDAARDVPRDMPTAMDSPVDVPRDVPRDVPIDRGTTPTDTGAGRCPSTCVNDIDCMSMCPAAGAGYLNCCLSGTGGGTCYQYMGSVCPSSTPTDSGTSTPDGSVFDTCHADSDCTGSTNCCAAIDLGGMVTHQCGCSSPFGCTPLCP